MTVERLIKMLQEMPQDARIDIEVIGVDGAHSTYEDSEYEVYEGCENNVVIQGFN